MFAHAIILYARAAKLRDSGRKNGIDLGRLYSPEHLRTHEAIVALRDRVIAHFDDEKKQDWLRDRLLLVVRHRADEARAEEWEYGYAFSRTSYQPKLFAEFRSLLAFVLPLIEEELGKENDIVHEAFEAAVASDPALMGEVTASEFDAIAFYGRSVVADELRKTIDQIGGRFVGNVGYPES